MRSSTPLSLLVACSLVTTLGCDMLKDLKKDAADGGPAEAGAAAASAVSSAGAKASAEPAPEEVKLPGACVDPAVDVKKRKDGVAFTLDESTDLDGDGKNDRIYTKVVSVYVGKFYFNFLYVMRGACGHFVGQNGAASWKPTGQKSQGLKSFELTNAEACQNDCDCVTRTASFVFNGTKYVEGKPGKDNVGKPCGASKDTGSAAKDAGAPSNGRR